MGILSAISHDMKGAKYVAFFFLFSLVAIFAGLVNVISEFRYSIEGVTVDAQVTGHDSYRDYDHNPVQKICYTYTTREGRFFNVEDDFGDDYYRLQKGNTFKIQYLSSDPNTDRPMGSHQNIWAGIISMIMGFAFFGLVKWWVRTHPDQMES